MLPLWNPFCKWSFQREVTSVISDIPGSVNSQDDFIVMEENFTGTWPMPEKGFLEDKRKWFEAKENLSSKLENSWLYF